MSYKIMAINAGQLIVKISAAGDAAGRHALPGTD